MATGVPTSTETILVHSRRTVARISRARTRDSAVQRQRPRHALSGKQLLECDENLVPTERWGDRTQNCLHDVRIVGNTELIWDG